MGLTISEKIIAKAAGLKTVQPGQVVTCDVDLAMIHDSGGPRRVKGSMEKLGLGVWDPEKIVLVSDHFAPCTDPESANILKLTREWAVEQNIENFYDQKGICHVVMPENGHLSPGMFAVGGDSHSPTGGAFGSYMFGIGATDMLGVLVTGQTWIKVPETIRIEWSGDFGVGVAAKDMALKMCATLGMDGGDYQSILYCGDTIKKLNMMERMTLCNMAAELGAQSGLIEPDERTAAYVVSAGGNPGNWQKYISDIDANYLITHRFDAFKLAKKLRIELFSTPFSIRAVDLLKKYNAKIYKIASFEITDFKLVDKIARTKKPVIISTGMASLQEINACIKIIKKYHKKIILLHCVSGYPTPEVQTNLKRLNVIKKKFPLYNVGLSDHTNDILTSLASIPFGVTIIEKHFMIRKNLNSLDKKFSILPKDLLELSKKSKRIFSALGKESFSIQKKEMISKYYRRSIFAVKEIKKNEKITNQNIGTFRPHVGLSANYYFKILGKRIKKNIKPFSPIFKKDII